MSPASDQFPILIVEDSDDDLFLFRRLLAKAEIANPLQFATNGQDAIDQLAKRIEGEGANEIPRLAFVDLKLPLRSGFEVLQWIRSQRRLRETVVLILSSSAEARDVRRAYELGAHGYLVKYPGPAVFRDVLRTVAMIPPGTSPDGISFGGMTRPE